MFKDIFDFELCLRWGWVGGWVQLYSMNVFDSEFSVIISAICLDYCAALRTGGGGGGRRGEAFIVSKTEISDPKLCMIRMF